MWLTDLYKDASLRTFLGTIPTPEIAWKGRRERPSAAATDAIRKQLVRKRLIYSVRLQ